MQMQQEEKQKRTRKLNIPGYMWRDEVKRKLNIDDGTLDAYAKNGTVQRIHPPGLKQWVYRKQDVDDIFEEMRTFIVLSKERAPVFARALPEEMPAIMDLIMQIFPEDPSPSEEKMQERITRRQAWLHRNPETCFVLRVEDALVGVIFLLPLLPELIDRILATEPTPAIKPEDVQPFEPGVPTHIFVMSLGISPRSTLGQKRFWGASLTRHIRRGFVNWGRRGIVIERIAARSDTRDGISLMRHMGFTEVPSVTHQRNFVIEVASSGIPQIMDYKDELMRFQGIEPPARPALQARLVDEAGKYEE